MTVLRLRIVNVWIANDLLSYRRPGWSRKRSLYTAGVIWLVSPSMFYDWMVGAGLIGGGCGSSCSKIFWIRSGSVISAMTRIVPPQSGHREMSILNTLLSRWAQDSGAISSSCRATCLIDLCVLLATLSFTILVLSGMISFLSFALIILFRYWVLNIGDK